MSKIKPNLKNSISTYAQSNREKLDIALLSLRIIKQIDLYMEDNNVSQKQLSEKLEVSEAFISQLMSGSKKINVQFLNKFEKCYNVEFDFKLKDKNYYTTFYEVGNEPIQLKSNNYYFKSLNQFSISNYSNELFEFNHELLLNTINK